MAGAVDWQLTAECDVGKGSLSAIRGVRYDVCQKYAECDVLLQVIDLADE